MHKIALESGSEPEWACLRELRGDDEEAVGAPESDAAIDLLDRLLVDQPGTTIGPGRAADLVLPDRDRLLAAIQVREFGPRVDSTVRCTGCEKPFDIDFDLTAFVASVTRAPPPVPVEREGSGMYRLADGRRFRLPRGTDERAVVGLPPAEAERVLLDRCMVEGASGDDPAALVEGMRAAGPMLDVDVGATCPECGHEQSIRFDQQHYLLSQLINQREQRALEIHQIAMAYRWSLAEILSLPRARRRLHAELIEREAAHR